jgi:hypothetical protein
MNNEPVAWVDLPRWKSGICPANDCFSEHKELEDDIPLYTHPAKTLTDEEIVEVFDNTFKVRDFEDYFLKFARAILRKAQEK